VKGPDYDSLAIVRSSFDARGSVACTWPSHWRTITGRRDLTTATVGGHTLFAKALRTHHHAAMHFLAILYIDTGIAARRRCDGTIGRNRYVAGDSVRWDTGRYHGYRTEHRMDTQPPGSGMKSASRTSGEQCDGDEQECLHDDGHTAPDRTLFPGGIRWEKFFPNVRGNSLRCARNFRPYGRIHPFHPESVSTPWTS